MFLIFFGKLDTKLARMILRSLESCWKSLLFPLWMLSSVVLVATEEGEGGTPPNTQPTGFDNIRLSGFDSFLLNPFIHGSPYHWDAPTDTVVEFARLRLELRKKFDPIRKRLRELDESIRELTNGTAKRLLEKAEDTKERIEDEAEERKNSFLDLKSEEEDKFREAERKSSLAEQNMELLEATMEENKKFEASEKEAFSQTFAADMGAITALLGDMQGKMNEVKAEVGDPNKTKKKKECKAYLKKLEEKESTFG